MEGLRLIASNEDLEVFYHPAPGDPCVITFTHIGRHSSGFGQRFVARRGIAALLVVSKWDHWYETPLCIATMGYCAAYLDAREHGRRVTYGTSMGGYGAARHGAVLRAQSAIMMAAQYSINPDHAPFERRWAKDAQVSGFAYQGFPELSADTAKIVAYDPLSPDRKHADLYLKLPNTIALPLPCAGHNVPTALRQAQLLSALVTEVLSDTFDRNALVRRYRAEKRASAEYWSLLATYACERARRKPQWFALAEMAARQALDLTPDNGKANALFNLSNITRFAEHHEAAYEYARQAYDLSPSSVPILRALASSARATRRYSEAAEAAALALISHPDEEGLKRFHADCLVLAQGAKVNA